MGQFFCDKHKFKGLNIASMILNTGKKGKSYIDTLLIYKKC